MKKSPCGTCQKKSECRLMCNRWKAWFTCRWIEIQKAACKKKGWDGLIDPIEVAPVVRCEGCVFSQSDGWVCGGASLMPQHRTFPNSFCSFGERKERKNDAT